MNTFTLKLIPLSPPRKVSLAESDCLSKDHSEENTIDEIREENPLLKEIEATKEQIEDWEEVYKSTVFRKTIANKRKKNLESAIEKETKKIAIMLKKEQELKEKYNKIIPIHKDQGDSKKPGDTNSVIENIRQELALKTQQIITL